MTPEELDSLWDTGWNHPEDAVADAAWAEWLRLAVDPLKSRTAAATPLSEAQHPIEDAQPHLF